MNNKKELLVLGATGGTGKAIIDAALKRGYQVTAFVRDAARARHLIDNSTHISFSEGDALNIEDIQRTIGSGFDAVISSLGIFHSKPNCNDLTLATNNIMDAMKSAGSKRFVCVSSLGVGDSKGQGNLIVKIIQKLSLRHTLQDKESQERAIRQSGLNWSIVRPSRLMNGNGPAEFLAWTGAAPEQNLIWQINRNDVAAFTLDCLEKPESIGLAYNVTGCK